MHEALSELAAGALRPVVAGALAKVERAALLGGVLAGCGVLAAAAVIGLAAAGAIALAPSVGPAAATAIAAGGLLVVAGAAGLGARRALRGGTEAPREAEAPAPEAPKEAPAAAPGAPGFKVDPVLITAAAATAAVILGPRRLMRAVRGTVDAFRLAASLAAGAELVKTLEPLLAALRGQDSGREASGAGPEGAAAGGARA